MNEKHIIKSADNTYLWFLSFYPKEYQREYGEQMLYVFRDLYREEIEAQGEISLFFWLRIIADVIISSSQQHMETIRNTEPKALTSKVIQHVPFALVIILFLLPALVDIIFTLPQLFVLFNINGSEAWGNASLTSIFSTPELFISGIIMSLVLYVITALHLIAVITRSKHRFMAFMHKIYMRFEPYIVISNTLSLSTFIMMVPSLFPISAITGIIFSNNTAILIKACVIAVITLVQYVKPNNILKSFGLLWFGAFSLFVGLTLYQIYIEFQPEYYGTFPLDDTKGVYKLNYDGDYWLTYYEVKEQCVRIANTKKCDSILEKKGNTSIAEAPEELDKYLDRSIRVTGEFIKIDGPEDNISNKQFCIKTGLLPKCRKSTGPGVWYFSPLKIQSIRIQKH